MRAVGWLASAWLALSCVVPIDDEADKSKTGGTGGTAAADAGSKGGTGGVIGGGGNGALGGNGGVVSGGSGGVAGGGSGGVVSNGGSAGGGSGGFELDGGNTGGSISGGGTGGAPSDACPITPGVAKMVVIPVVNGKGFCIDSTEVTIAEYSAFLSSPIAVAPAAGCEGNVTFAPTCVQDQAHPNWPVTCVDWCDAEMYCRTVGKHLCRRIGGGSLMLGEINDPTRSQWFTACSKGGTISYPYGMVYSATACNGADSNLIGLQNVGALATCQGGYPGLFDMSGNVAEWEDACDGSLASSLCALRGGTSLSQSSGLACNATSNSSRMAGAERRGFRCCYD